MHKMFHVKHLQFVLFADADVIDKEEGCIGVTGGKATRERISAVIADGGFCMADGDCASVTNFQ